MSAQNVSIAAMFSWVNDSLKLFKKNFSSLLIASFITLLLAVLMMAPLFVFMFSTLMKGNPNGAMPMNADMTPFFIIYAATIAVSTLLFPPILVGWFRMCQNMDRNIAVSGLDILKPYKDTRVWLRSMVYALLALMIYLAIIGLFVLAFSGVIGDIIQLSQAQQAAIAAGTNPPVPNFSPAAFIGLFFGYIVFILIMLFLQFVYMVGFTEIALRETTSTLDALKLAFTGVLKNAHKLLVFLFAVYMIASICMMMIFLLLAVVVGLLALVYQPLGFLVGGIFYLGFLLCMYPPMFAGHYFMWKSMLNGDNVPAIPDIGHASLPV